MNVINELRQHCLIVNAMFKQSGLDIVKVLSEEMENKAKLVVRELSESLKNIKSFDELEIVKLKFKKDLDELMKVISSYDGDKYTKYMSLK